MQEYHLQFGRKWKKFTVPQMVQWIYAAQQRLHLTAIATCGLGVLIGLGIGWFWFGA